MISTRVFVPSAENTSPRAHSQKEPKWRVFESRLKQNVSQIQAVRQAKKGRCTRHESYEQSIIAWMTFWKMNSSVRLNSQYEGLKSKELSMRFPLPYQFIETQAKSRERERWFLSNIDHHAQANQPLHSAQYGGIGPHALQWTWHVFRKRVPANRRRVRA